MSGQGSGSCVGTEAGQCGTQGGGDTGGCRARWGFRIRDLPARWTWESGTLHAGVGRVTLLLPPLHSGTQGARAVLSQGPACGMARHSHPGGTGSQHKLPPGSAPVALL